MFAATERAVGGLPGDFASQGSKHGTVPQDSLPPDAAGFTENQKEKLQRASAVLYDKTRVKQQPNVDGDVLVALTKDMEAKPDFEQGEHNSFESDSTTHRATLVANEGEGINSPLCLWQNSSNPPHVASYLSPQADLQELDSEWQARTQTQPNPALLALERLIGKGFETPLSLDPTDTSIGPSFDASSTTLTGFGTSTWIIEKLKSFGDHFSDFVVLDESHESESTFMNNMKNAVERYLEANVIWWPLATVRKQVKPHEARISWMCVSHSQRPTHAFELS